jgi:hypothetical protein
MSEGGNREINALLCSLLPGLFRRLPLLAVNNEHTGNTNEPEHNDHVCIWHKSLEKDGGRNEGDSYE